jgi:hypothetical protein
MFHLLAGYLTTLLGSGHSLIVVLSEHFHGWTEENREISVRLAGIMTEIQTDERSNKNAEGYN